MSLLQIRDLAIALPKGADRPHAVEQINFDLAAGEILCIVGESGSGKSMSANAVMGLLPEGVVPVKGSITFDGTDILGWSEVQMRAVRGRKIGMIFQEPLSALNPLMRVGAQIAEVFEAHGLYSPAERQQRALDLLREVQLPDPEKAIRAYPFQLSGGQRQRVMIAMALALEPRILIADEPTTALDVTTQAQILKLIEDLRQKRGMAVIFITHDFGVVADIADRVIVMEKGLIVEHGSVDDVLLRSKHPYTQKLVRAIPGIVAAPKHDFSDAPVILRVDGLTKVFTTGGGFFSKPRIVRALDDVSFALYTGETIGIVGESGSGKSTCGRAIVRLLEPDSGTVEMAGVDMAKLKGADLRANRRKIQMIFQDPFSSLNPRARVGRILSEGLIGYGTPPREAMARARELLSLVGLDASAVERFPHEFSGGQRQRIGIARALALDPDIIIADEAVSALDVSIQAQVLALLADLKTRLNLSMLFITHDLRVAAQVCDRIMVMQHGKVVEIGPANRVLMAPEHPYTRSLLDAVPGKEYEEALKKVVGQ